MIELNRFKRILEDYEERFPLLTLAGDSIVLCTNIPLSKLEKMVNCKWLCSDGIIEIEPSELDIYSCIPSIPENFNCFEIVWD